MVDREGLLLLDANPLEDIKNTQSIWRVIKGGWVLIRRSCGRSETNAPVREFIWPRASQRRSGLWSSEPRSEAASFTP